MSASGLVTADRAVAEHITRLEQALGAVRDQEGTLTECGHWLADTLLAGGRVLAAGNGGSAAHAQHLTSELVGRYRAERIPFAAIALHADTSSLTAIANDYGLAESYARQVLAHGRPGDVFVGISTSGTSANILAAAHAARTAGLRTIALTGVGPNPLTRVSDRHLAVPDTTTATVQEVHQVMVHLLCDVVDRRATDHEGDIR